MRSYDEVVQAYNDIMGEITKPRQSPHIKAALQERLQVLNWVLSSNYIDVEIKEKTNDTTNNITCINAN